MAEHEDRPTRGVAPEERSPLAGGCALLVLGGAGFAAVFAVSAEGGILAVWLAGVAAVWWSARRRKGTYQPLPSPTGLPSPHDKEGGQTTLVHREGMVIYLTPDATNPVRTHVHVQPTGDETHA
ncbi:hypothetical protein JK361_22635 [Streptomyces sp. 5-8]|uniref:Uncharacterized protein n=1 Tax=Streptomyces musisoli TaxID=2802280 RepID=A0ABS1P4R5_9ACTN|nr:hypothetical protein [Streptomyces musisoli]MBL1107367.1 hypothetical protein [Streptomyces musisoli]